MAEALHSSGLGGGGMAALGGASSRCLAQISQLLEAIDLPCDPRRKPHEQERTVRVRVRVRVSPSPSLTLTLTLTLTSRSARARPTRGGS